MAHNRDGAEALGAGTARTPLLAWIGLAILMTFYLLSFLDKQMLSLLANPIGESLKLSDVDLGVLQGLAFSVTYSVGTIAAGVAVDRYSPRMVIFGGVLIWSLASAAGGLTESFHGLFLTRALVGLGEGVLAPAATAIIVAMFPRDRLGVAMGTYAVGANLGGVIALLLGGAAIGALTSTGGMSFGLFGHRDPWQAALIITGLPGVALAFLIFGIRPSFMRPRAVPAADLPQPDHVSLIAYIRRYWFFFAIHAGVISLLGVTAYTLIAWSPAHFGRAFGWGHEQIALAVAAGVATGGFANVLWGAVADAWRRRGRSEAPYLLFAILTFVGIPISAICFLSTNATVAILFYPLTWLTLNAWGSLVGALQLTIPDALRGRMTAIQTVLVGLIGIGLAPIIVGWVSDDLLGGKEHLGEAIALVLGTAGGIAVLLFLLGRNAFRDIVDTRAADVARGMH